MITLEKISIESFGSIRSFSYKFDKPGINMILGKNGSGKTTILNALAWCLFNQLVKKGSSIEPWPHTLTKDSRGTCVIVKFRKDGKYCEVVRCRGWKGKVNGKLGGNGLFLFKEGKLIKSKYKRNIQPEIEKVLGYSFELFKSAVLFGQELQRLIKESGPNKRRVFEEAFDTFFIEEARQKVIKRLETRKAEHSRLTNRCELFDEQLKSFDDNTKRICRVNQDQVNEFKKDIVTLKKEILGIKKSMSKIDINGIKNCNKNIEKRVEKYQRKINMSLTDEEFRLSMWINGKEQQVEEVNDIVWGLINNYKNIPKICDKCKQKLPKSKIKGYKERIHQDLIVQKKNLKKLRIELKSMKDQYQEVLDQLVNQKSYIDKVSKFKKTITLNQKMLVDFKVFKSQKYQKINEVKTLKNKIQNLYNKQLVLKDERGSEKVSLVSRYNETKYAKEALSKKIKMDEWLMNDPLSSGGMRAYIFESMLQAVNESLSTYSYDIGFDMRIEVNLESSRKDIGVIITKKDDEVPYEDLSKGQKQLADVALAFAINDTITKTKPINTLFMDEIFESLSSDNIEIVGDMVMKKAKNTCIHIINHQSAFNPPNSNKLTLILDKNGNTKAA